jgi:radical SAM family uncharacterized protein/radical SAM-linked protein
MIINTNETNEGWNIYYLLRFLTILYINALIILKCVLSKLTTENTEKILNIKLRGILFPPLCALGGRQGRLPRMSEKLFPMSPEKSYRYFWVSCSNIINDDIFNMMNFCLFQTPSRYINSEINSLRKPHAVVRSVLAFPDVYEVGMSHLGLKILFDVINSLPYASAERVFSPWIDFEEYLRRQELLLASLESGTPLKNFDILGFSLQYELSYTTVLNMTALGGIPVYAEERLNASGSLPVIIAGGPCTVNPSVMSPFIDAFLVGEAEEAIVELFETTRRWKLNGDGQRKTLLREIAGIEGFYVPLIHKQKDKIKRRFVHNLDEAPYPLKPVVPFTGIVHDRIAVEVSRGCAMGCRFCQAGFIYRPLRHRSPEKVLNIAGMSLHNTGYEDVSFVSLSSGDYPYLLQVIREFNRRYGKSKVALSLPSLRVASVNRDVLSEIRSVRKTGFTIAPEAATPRLRDVINKDFSEDDYERSLNVIFSEGWLNLKLYFMIGLPTESDEDVEAIHQMVMKALKTARKSTRRFVNISVTVSPFIPKPHTPFQWHGRASHEDIWNKLVNLKDLMMRKKIKFKGHNEKMNLLEAVFARGNQDLSRLVYTAWQLGCRLDAWTEVFDYNKWQDAMDKTGIDGNFYAQRHFGIDEVLPWENIDSGVSKPFLLKEFERARSASKTPDCDTICSACGLECGKTELKIDSDIKTTEPNSSSTVADSVRYGSKRIRAQYSKTGMLRYLSHHELMRVILRALRRAKVPLLFSQGFHPAPLVSFSPPLNVGVAGEREYFDMELAAPFDIIFYIEQLNSTLPEGIKIRKMAEIDRDEPSLNSFITRYEYKLAGLDVKLEALKREGLIVERQEKEIDISVCLEDVFLNGDENGNSEIRIIIADRGDLKVRLGEIISAVLNKDIKDLEITRTHLYGWNNSWMEPL